MKNTIYSSILVLLCVLTASTMAGCHDSGKKAFNRLLLQLAEEDHIIDHNDWVAIEKWMNDNASSLSELREGNRPDIKKTKEYITDFFKKRRPSTDITFVGIGGKPFLAVHLYLERSGSMTPYDSREGDGVFKSAIVQLLNSLPGDNADNRIYIVNSTVNAYPKGFDRFLSDTDIFESTKGIGDASYTDFSSIFSDLLDKTGDNDLSILVTDMIYSTKSMSGVSPEKIFNEAEGMANAVFKNFGTQKSMLVVKLHSGYHGPYYSYDTPSSGRRYDGQRPYYMVIVASNANMARLTTDSHYQVFARMTRIKGYEDEYLFSAAAPYNPYHSLLLNHRDIHGRFKPERGSGTQVTSITDVETDPETKDLKLILAVDLSHMFIADSYLANPKNYEITSGCDMKITSVRPIKSGDLTEAEKRYAGTATHLFTLCAGRTIPKDEIHIRLKNKLPAWVADTSTDDDRDTHAADFSKTTFGLKYLLGGIYQSYKKSAGGVPDYFDLELKLSE